MVKFLKFCLPLLPAIYALDATSQSHSKFNGWAKDGNADEIRRHLKDFEDSASTRAFVSQGDHWSKSAAHYAAEHGHADIIRMLKKEYKADINAVDYRGRTPLHLAAMNGNIDAIKELLTLNKNMINVKDNEGRNALHFAAETGQYMVIKIFNGKLDINEVSGTGKSALMLASERGHVDFVNAALKNGARQDLQDATGMTAMMMAAKIGHQPIVSTLMRAEGGREVLHLNDRHGRNAFLYGVASGQSSLVDWLLKNSGDESLINSVDTNNVNALHLAAKYGHQNICSLLIHEQPHMMFERDNFGQTSLHMATRLPESGFTEILEFHTPLPLGKYTCLDMMLKNMGKLRLEEGGDQLEDVVNIKDSMKQTALSRAVEYGCSTTVNRLFKAGADPATTVDTKNSRMRKMNMLHWAIYKNQLGCVDSLIKHGVDRASKMGPDNATPLLLAIKQGNYLATVKMLHYNNKAEHNVLEITDKGATPRTPLIWATIQGNGDILKAVIGNGANINFQADNQDLTALHFAAAKGDNEIATILLNAGADYNRLDANGISPLDTALYYNNPSILKNLIYHYEKDLGESEPEKLTEMFEKAITFTQNQKVNLNTAADVAKRDEVLDILNDAAKNHFEMIAGEMDLSAYTDNLYGEYYEYFYPDEFFEAANYEDYGNLDVVGRRKRRSPRHLKN